MKCEIYYFNYLKRIEEKMKNNKEITEYEYDKLNDMSGAIKKGKGSFFWDWQLYFMERVERINKFKKVMARWI